MQAFYKPILSVIDTLRNRYCFYKDFRTSRRIVVFESDDWGAIRVPSREVWEQLISEGYAMDKRPYERYDTLETNEDVEALFDVLRQYKDSKGNHPIITANYLSQNPNFDAIRENGFSEYVGESIIDTYKSYPLSDRVIDLMKQGIKEGLVMPQCHGREHYNVLSWMDALRNGDEDVLSAFRHNMCGIFPKNAPSVGNKYMIALKTTDMQSQKYVCDSIADSLGMFEKMWGFKSRSFVAPCYTWNDEIEKVLSDNGVEMLQSSRIQRLSDDSNRRFRFSGEKNQLGMVYSIRNCFFEPSTSQRVNELTACLNDIRTAFLHKKPAVVSIHRINFVGGTDLQNRERNLHLFEKLLEAIVNEYPEVEFMSSSALLNVLKQ